MRSLATLLLLVSFLGLTAQSAEDLARDAAKQQDAKRYEQAIASYESLITQGYSSSDLHYNLGLAYYQNTDLGHAILHLEKAYKLAPYDKQVEKNLELIRNEQVDGLLPLPTFFLYEWWHKIAARLQPDIWAVLAIVLAILGAVGFIFWFRFRKSTQPPTWYPKWHRRFLLGSPVVLLLALLFVLFANSRNQALANFDKAVLLAPEVALYAAPNQESTVDLTLHEGLRVRILDNYEGWRKIELVDGRSGWVQKDTLEAI